MSELPERTALYRLYDKADQLLYVGIAGDPKKRWYQHATESHWHIMAWARFRQIQRAI